MSAYYMPIGALSWLSLARQLDRARKALEKGDHTFMRVYRNTREGLSYRDSETSTTVEQLTDRTEDFAMRIVPDRAMVLTAAVDTQADRLEVQIEAWGPDMEHWVIDYQVLSPPNSPVACGPACLSNPLLEQLTKLFNEPQADDRAGKLR